MIRVCQVKGDSLVVYQVRYYEVLIVIDIEE